MGSRFLEFSEKLIPVIRRNFLIVLLFVEKETYELCFEGIGLEFFNFYRSLRTKESTILLLVNCKIESFIILENLFLLLSFVHEYREARIRLRTSGNYPEKGIWKRVDYRKRSGVLSGVLSFCLSRDQSLYN